jgi:predicted ABC-type transport system involved in lysophospholipase L1 biosynthesis ATPase subunit
MSAALLEIRGLVKDYQSLRPLRVRELSVSPRRILSLAGFDGPAAEIFVHLVTGASLPDDGEVALFGTNTRHVTDAQAWLRSLDGLGVVSHRAVLIDMLSVLQNVAIPLTLDIDPIDPELLPKVQALAREAGLDEADWHRPLGQVDAEANLRVRLARALAPEPTLVIAEHPSAGLPRELVGPVASHVAAVVKARNAALVTLTADAEWVRHTGGEVLTLSPATGELAAGGRFMERLKRVFGGG